MLIGIAPRLFHYLPCLHLHDLQELGKYSTLFELEHNEYILLALLLVSEYFSKFLVLVEIKAQNHLLLCFLNQLSIEDAAATDSHTHKQQPL